MTFSNEIRRAGDAAGPRGMSGSELDPPDNSPEPWRGASTIRGPARTISPHRPPPRPEGSRRDARARRCGCAEDDTGAALRLAGPARGGRSMKLSVSNHPSDAERLFGLILPHEGSGLRDPMAAEGQRSSRDLHAPLHKRPRPFPVPARQGPPLQRLVFNCHFRGSGRAICFRSVQGCQG
jgi:hypothetical protein